MRHHSVYRLSKAMLWILFVIVILLMRRWKLKRILELSNKIKCGIRSYPLIGHGYLFYGDGEKQMAAIQKLSYEAIKNKSMTNMWLGGKYYLFSVDAADSELILKKALDKDDASNIGRNLTGNGTIFAPMEIWRPRRKGMAPMFSLKQLNRLMEVFSRQADIMVDQMKVFVGKEAMPIWQNLITWTLDTVCETTLDVQLDAQLHSENQIVKSFEICGKLLASRMLQPWLYYDILYKMLPSSTEFEKNKKILIDFINEAVRSKRKQLKDGKKNAQNSFKTTMEFLIESGYSDLELQEDTFVIVIAATETSAITTGFCITMMARHSDVQEKVVQELQEVFGNSDRPVTLNDLSRLNYLEAVIKETLRLYPAVPIVGRSIKNSLELPSGITLVEGCAVIVSIWGIHRNPKYWGKDAEHFRPERFLETPLKCPTSFLPFSLGIRGCIGSKYGMMSVKTALATFLRKYRVLNADENVSSETKNIHESIRLTYEVLIKDLNGCNVRLENRKKSQ